MPHVIDKLDLIKNQACFSPLNDEEREMLADLFKEKYFKTGDTIVTEGDIVDSVYLIDSGRADVRHVYLKDGVLKFDSLAQLGPRQAIGLSETGFYSITGVRTATVVALTDMVTLKLSVAAFNGFALAYPRVKQIIRKFSHDQVGSSK